MLKLLTILFVTVPLLSRAEPIHFIWNQSPDARIAGWKLYIAPLPMAGDTSLATYALDSGTNLSATFAAPSGTWYASAVSYTFPQNQEFGSPFVVESLPSNEMSFYVPGIPTNGVPDFINYPFVTPIVSFSTNSNARVTVYLQGSTDMVQWSSWLPVVNYEMPTAGTNTFFRSMLVIRPL